MTDAGSRTPQGHVIGTWRRWGRGRRLLVAAIGALVVLAVGAISAAALGGFPSLFTGSSTSSPTSDISAGESQAGMPANDFAALAPGGATLSTLASPTPNQITYVCV